MINTLKNQGFFSELNQEASLKINAFINILNDFISKKEISALTFLTSMQIFDSPNPNNKFSFKKLLDICGKVFALTGNSTKSLAN